MYEDWTDLELTKGEHSVLDRFNVQASKSISASVADELCRQLNSQSSSLINDSEVKWCMQVVCYALGLPFTTDYGTIRNAVRVYCDWLTCILNEPHTSVPRPLFEQPLYYSREIINHLHHLFLPRTDSLNSDVILRQAKECHHVLRCIQNLIMQAKTQLQKELWPEVLRFLLSINDALLSPPFEQDDISDQLCDRVLSVLFELWIAASANGHFPSPSYWKTFRALCHRWRHRVHLIDHWVKTLLVLTYRKLIHLYGENYCKMQINEEDQKLVPNDMNPELVVQTWYRVLHLIGKPVELATSQLFDASPKFREFVNKHGGDAGIIDPSDHPCLVHLPYCFFRAMSGIHCMVSGMLGENVDCSFRGPEKVSKELNNLLSQAMTHANVGSTSSYPSVQSGVSSGGSNSSNQPPALIRAALGFGLSSSGSIKTKEASKVSLPPKATISLNQLSDSVIICAILKSTSLSLSKSITYPSKRPSVESLCKLFGDWLFSVANIKPESIRKHTFDDALSQKSGGSQQSSSDAENSLKSSGQLELRALVEHLPAISGYQAGKAEALAALCKLFSFKDSKEVLPERLLGKFYSALLDTLIDNDTIVSGYLVFYSVNLFRVGLRGIELLIPHFLDCLDVLCIESDKTKIHPSLSDVEMRRASLHLLSSLICVPTYYSTSNFTDINHKTEHHTFIGLRQKMMRILLHELKIETDSQNLQVCLGLISLFCQACWLWECDELSVQSDSYVREAVHYVLLPLCESLCGKWNSDFPVCIAALDCLCSLIRVHSSQQKQDGDVFNTDEVVLYLCKFVDVQLSKPPPSHSRDLHSTVVSAFYCLETWLVFMPNLLRSELCLKKVAEVIQLGLTGAKPDLNDSINDALKKPASQRVYDAAEQLLHTIFNRVGISFNMCDAPEDEEYLDRRLVDLTELKENGGARLKFSYVFVDNSFIFAVSNINLHKDLPSAALVLRSPFTRSTCWTFSFRFRPKDKEKPLDFVPRPEGEEKPKLVKPISVYFPPDVDKVEKCKIDYSIPELDVSPALDKMKALLKKISVQNTLKESVFEKLDAKHEPVGNSIDATKLFLQTFGYFDIENGESKCQLLRNENDEFLNDLKNLDACPSRFIETVHIFYVQDNKTSAVEILQNGMELESVSQQFRDFLAKLGVGVNVQSSCLWTGHWSTAFHNATATDQGDFTNQSENGKHYVLDGISNVLYWATPLVEMAFLVPTVRSYKLANRNRARSSPRDSFDMRPFDASFVSEFCSTNPNPNTVANRRPHSTTLAPTVQLCLDKRENNANSSFSSSWDNTRFSLDNSMMSSSVSTSDFKQKSARLKTVLNFAFNNNKKDLSSSYRQLDTVEINATNNHCLLNAAASPPSASHVTTGATGDFLNTHPVPPPRSKSISHNDEALNNSAVKVSNATSLVAKKRNFIYQDYRVLVVWLECLEDNANFPRDDLLVVTDVGEDGANVKPECVYIIFISTMDNGMYRLKFSMNASRLGLPHPLVDGAVISGDLLSTAVRQTSLSIGLRRRLEQDGYVQPFIKRRQKIQEFGTKFASVLPVAEFLGEVLKR